MTHVNTNISAAESDLDKYDATSTVRCLEYRLTQFVGCNNFEFRNNLSGVTVFKTGMSDDCWSIFTYFGMMYNRAWIYDFCARVSTRLEVKIAAWSTVAIVLCVCCVSELGPVRVSHSYSDTRAPVHNILLYSQPGRSRFWP